MGSELGVHQFAEAGRVAGEQVADRLRGEHGARPDPAHLEPAAGEQLAQLLGAVAAGDGAVRPRDEHHVGVGHVDQVRPAVLLGQHRHPEHQRVHAGEHLPAGTEHARDLGHHVLGRQLQGQRAVLGDHTVGAAVGKELQARSFGRHRAEAMLAARDRRVGRVGRVGRQGGRADDAQHVVAGVGGQLGGARAGARYVDEKPGRGRQPVVELREGDRGVKTRIVGGRTGVLIGAGDCLHGITPGREPVRVVPHGR